MSARILIFPKKAVRTRALRLQEQRKRQNTKALYVQELFEEEKHQEQDQEQRQKKYVRTACTREDANQRILAYLKTQFRNDLRAAGADAWRNFALQLWSALHPDPAVKATRPIADIRRYTRALLARIDAGNFMPPPRIAQTRRDKARAERRRASASTRIEARRLAEVTAALARGDYPGHGLATQRLE